MKHTLRFLVGLPRMTLVMAGLFGGVCGAVFLEGNVAYAATATSEISVSATVPLSTELAYLIGKNSTAVTPHSAARSGKSIPLIVAVRGVRDEALPGYLVEAAATAQGKSLWEGTGTADSHGEASLELRIPPEQTGPITVEFAAGTAERLSALQQKLIIKIFSPPFADPHTAGPPTSRVQLIPAPTNLSFVADLVLPNIENTDNLTPPSVPDMFGGDYLNDAEGILTSSGDFGGSRARDGPCRSALG